MMLYDYILLLSVFLFAFGGTGVAYGMLRRFQVLDNPNARSNHAIPTPRGGGLGVVFALSVFLTVLQAPLPLVVGMLVLAVVSFIDDLRGLSARVRFAVQAAVVVWVLLTQYNGQLLGEWLPRWIELPLLVLAWLWFINLFNFMDGSDGLAGGEAMLVTLGIAAVAWPLSPIHPLVQYALITGVAALGFLPWNWHRAKVFMGDVGSVPLGFLLGFLLVTLAGKGYLAAALILPAVFLLDATSVLVKRLLRGERISEAHSQHAYQQAIRGGMTHDAVAIEVFALNLLLILLALLSTFGTLVAWCSVVLAYAVTALLLRRFHRMKAGAA